MPAVSKNISEYFRGAKAASPIILGFIPFGLLLGSQAAQKGMRSFQMPLMTGLNFAGGSEFAAVGLWASVPPLLLIVGVTFLINSRHLLMGIALAPYLKKHPKPKILFWLAFMMDESWALTMEDIHKAPHKPLHEKFSPRFFMGGALLLWVTWVGATFLGAYAGGAIGDLTKYGFGMAFPAVFLVILRGMWKGWLKALPWMVSLLVAVLTYLYLPGQWYVSLGTLAGGIAAWIVTSPSFLKAKDNQIEAERAS